MVGKCGVSVGKCEKECATVTLEEHTKCGCGCQLDRVDCELDGLHRFKSELCQCECLDVAAKRSCLEQGRTWAESTCTCGCAAATQCLPGWTWETGTCSCVELPKVQEKLKEEEATRGKEDQEVKLSLELFIITGLLSLLGVLLILVVVLAIRLRHARKEERSAGRVLLVPSTLSSGHYVPGADPCADLKKARKGTLRANQRPAPASESGSDKPGSSHCEQTNDGNEQLTDSSLCSEQEKELSGGSCESLPPPYLRHGSQPCLQSVGLSRHLAIRPGPEGGSLRLQRPPRHLQPYPGPGDLPPKPSYSGDRRPSQTYLPGVSHNTFSGESPLLPGHSSYRSESPLQPLPCPNTYYNSPSRGGGGSESPYNTVKIVYKKGERRMELSCQVEPTNPQWTPQMDGSNQPALQITENPYCSYNM